MRSGILFCLVGPAGGGKTTVAQKLLQEFADSLSISVSVTSRSPREGEIDGKSYVFVTKEDFKKRVSNNEFFEWEEVHGNYYGTLKASFEQVKTKNKDLLLVIDIRGALNVKKHYPDNTVICFLVPPSLEALESRLRARGAIKEEDFKRRLATARDEYLALMDKGGRKEGIDYLVVNDSIELTCDTVSSVLKAESCNLQRLPEVDLNLLAKGIL